MSENRFLSQSNIKITEITAIDFLKIKFFRYKEVTLEEAKNNKKVEMTFSVSYRYLQLILVTTFVNNYPTRQNTKKTFFQNEYD